MTRYRCSPGGEGGLPYESDGDARRKFQISPLKGTNLGVAQEDLKKIPLYTVFDLSTQRPRFPGSVDLWLQITRDPETGPVPILLGKTLKSCSLECQKVGSCIGPNRQYWYSHGWSGTSLQSRLMRGNLDCKLVPVQPWEYEYCLFWDWHGLYKLMSTYKLMGTDSAQ